MTKNNLPSLEPYLAKLIEEAAFHNLLPVIDVFDTDNKELQEDIEELEEMRFSYTEKAQEIAKKNGIAENHDIKEDNE